MKGDTLTLTIPKQIKIDAPGEFGLRVSNGDLIGTGIISTNGDVVVTFTEFAETHSNVTGSFWFDLYFDESKIGLDDPTTIKFEVGGTTNPFEISIDFEQPAPLPTSIAKTGAYNAQTNEITWTLTANPENVVVRDAQVVDAISDGLEFVPGSVTLNGQLAPVSDYTYSGGTLTYNLPAVITTQQVITFKTTVNDSRLTTENSHGTTIVEKNTATMHHDGTFVISNEASVNVPINFISKTGNYNSTTKQIEWTIEVNQNGVSVSNAIVTDALPTGLTLDTTNITIDGVASSAFTYTHPNIAFNLGAISEKHTIKFYTNVEQEAFTSNTPKKYTNTARLTGDGVPGNATSGEEVEASTNIIRKQGVSYNKANGEITWRATVNENKISIQNPVITDFIKIGQEYVAGSATIDKGADVSKFAYTPAVDGDTTKTGTLTYIFGTTISDSYIIEFKTKVTDPTVFAGNANTTYKNEASITGDNITESKSVGSQNVVSEVVKKTGAGYDYTTRIISWKVVVNGNQMLLNNAVFTDNIPKGMKYIEGTAAIDNGADPTGFFYSPTSDESKSGTLTYTFPATINQTYTITFQTQVTDLSIFQTNGDKAIQNTSTLRHNIVPGGVVSTGTQNIRNTVISKTGAYTSGKKYIDWTININANSISLSDAAITDKLQEGLALDTASVKLFHQSIDSSGNLIVGGEIPLTAANVQYDLAERMFTFHLPSPDSGSYRLTFRTNVTDKTKSPFLNQAKFNGTGSLQQGDSQPIVVSWAGSGSTGAGEVGSIKVFKVDAENKTTKLQGAKFELIDKYGNVVDQATTGTDGFVLFDMLRFDVPYTVKEINAPTGYVISSTGHTFTIKGVDTTHDISYEYANERIYGGIRFSKLGAGGSPLAGAEFSLYDQGGNIVATAISIQSGEVLFEHIPYGDYSIRETNPPQGYFITNVVLTASIRENNVIVTAAPASVSNQVMQGNIQVKKTQENRVTPLKNAEFTLYLKNDTNFSTPIASAVTGEDGIALFHGISYGEYIVKETVAPAGFVLSNTLLTVNVSEDGKTYDLGVFTNKQKQWVNTPQIRGDIEILKINTEKEPLQGAKFALYDEGGNLVAEAASNIDGRVKFTDILYGNYTIMETQAPDMYVKSNQVIKADILSDGAVLQYTVINEKSDGNSDGDDKSSVTSTVPKSKENIPQTGDTTLAMVWLFAISCLSNIALLLLGKKINKKQENN